MRQGNQPIKRHLSLQSISREHHQILMLCWKIRSGFRKGVCKQRIQKYTRWFYLEYLLPHFKAEEQHIFPLLGLQNDLVKRALSERKKLHKLFQFEGDPEICLGKIEEDLEAHVRFEERVLLNKIQEATNEQLLLNLETQISIPVFCDNEEDVFW
jgi:hemerythrin superfamily protein